MATIEILAKRAEAFQITGAELTAVGVRFHEGHLPVPYRTPAPVRAAIKARPAYGQRTYRGIQYMWGQHDN